jgi:hypothetical protein
MLLCTKTTEEIRAAGAGQNFRTYGHLRGDADGDVAGTGAQRTGGLIHQICCNAVRLRPRIFAVRARRGRHNIGGRF